jgi:hypothetical protein
LFWLTVSHLPPFPLNVGFDRPNLFVIAINELSIRLQAELENMNLSGVSLGPDYPPIRSLLFADDLILCGQASLAEATTIYSIFHHFS